MYHRAFLQCPQNWTRATAVIENLAFNSILNFWENSKFKSKIGLKSPYQIHIKWLSRTTDPQWRHKSKISEKLGRCGRQNMFRPYLKIWDWIFGRLVKAISSLGVSSPWFRVLTNCIEFEWFWNFHKIRYSVNISIYLQYIAWP